MRSKRRRWRHRDVLQPGDKSVSEFRKVTWSFIPLRPKILLGCVFQGRVPISMHAGSWNTSDLTCWEVWSLTGRVMEPQKSSDFHIYNCRQTRRSNGLTSVGPNSEAGINWMNTTIKRCFYSQLSPRKQTLPYITSNNVKVWALLFLRRLQRF